MSGITRLVIRSQLWVDIYFLVRTQTLVIAQTPNKIDQFIDRVIAV